MSHVSDGHSGDASDCDTCKADIAEASSYGASVYHAQQDDAGERNGGRAGCLVATIALVSIPAIAGYDIYQAFHVFL